MSLPEISCRCCSAFVNEDKHFHSTYGFCHRWPPAPGQVWNMKEDRFVLEAIWPRVYELDFCLEFVPLPDDEEDDD